jgi:hypothetical protein
MRYAVAWLWSAGIRAHEAAGLHGHADTIDATTDIQVFGKPSAILTGTSTKAVCV